MGRLLTAFRAFFAVLFSSVMCARLREAMLLDKQSVSQSAGPVQQPTQMPVPAVLHPPRQSEAVTLLATFQREARLVDFLKEELGGYSDEQVGAAVREIHRECALVMDRLFAIRPILNEEEGAEVTVPAGFDAARFRLTGKLAGEGPFRGKLRHHGWEVARCEIPEFIGSESAAKTIMPAEVEIV